MTKDVVRVFITNLIKFFVSLIATFLIPALLSVDEYGYYKVYGLYAAYLGMFHFGFCDGMFLEYGGKNIDSLDKKRLSNERFSLLVSEIIITSIFLVIGVIRKDLIIIALGLTIIPGVFITFYTYLYQSTGDFQKYSRVYNLNSIITLIVNGVLVFVIRPSSGLIFVYSTVAVSIIVFVYASYSFQKQLSLPRGGFEAESIKRNVGSGILLLFGNLSYLLFDSIDRWFVKGLLGLTFFAFYSFAGQLLSALNMFANPIGLTLYSHLSRNKNEDFEYTIKISIMSMLLFMLNGVFVLRWIVNIYFLKYEAARPVIIILFGAHIFLLMNTIIYVNLYKTYKKQRKYFISLLIVIGLSVAFNAFNFFVIDKSMVMIAMATLFSMMCWTIFNSLNFPYLKLKMKHFFAFIGLLCVYFATSFLLNEFLGLLVYFVLWLVCFRFFYDEVYLLVIGKGKTFLDIIMKKNIKN